MPLTFDLPLDELYTYTGRNPKPADFDDYWQRALAEMRAVEPNVEIVPSAFQAPYAVCSDLFFTGVGGSRIHAKLMQPRVRAESGPALLKFHGYTGNAGQWMDHLAWVAAGFTVAALDCRGQGGLSEDRGGVSGNTHRGHIIRGLSHGPDHLLFRNIFLDTAQLADIVCGLDGVDADRLYATGASQGGALTLACAALEPRVKRAAPVYPFLCDYQRVWEMDNGGSAYEELRTWFRLFDPLHEREEEVFTTLGYIAIQHLAPRITAEVYMAVALMDQVCPPSTQFAAYNAITAPKRLELYPDFAHEKLPDHDDRIFAFLTAP